MNLFTPKLISLVCCGLLASSICASFAFGQSNRGSSSSSQTKAQPAADRNKYAIIISGASGEAAYAKQFAQWTLALRAALVGKFGFAEDRLKVLIEKPTDSTTAPAIAEEVKRIFVSLRTELNPDNVFFIFLIGHGSFDGKEAKFNLVGPDLSAGDFNNLLSSLPTHRVVIFDMTSTSGEFIKPLSAKGRVIVTATRSGQETNATRFAASGYRDGHCLMSRNRRL